MPTRSRKSVQTVAVEEDCSVSKVLETFKKLPLDAAFLQKPAHLRTRAERYELGKALRVTSPREAHAEFSLDKAGRRDPIDVLIEQAEGRIPDLLPIRYGRMLASPFAFFRGAASIMAADLASAPCSPYAVQSCGDCHLMNFGAFATPERNVIFDINDFDETFPAPFEWDVKRLAVSFVIAGNDNGHKLEDGLEAARHAVESYRDRLHELAEMKALEAWYSYLDFEELIDLTSDPKLKKRHKRALEKALTRDSSAEFVKLAHVVDGVPKIKEVPPLIFHPPKGEGFDLHEQVTHGLNEYRNSLPFERRVLFDRYEYCDTAMKVVGVGSVGTHCAVLLFFSAEGDPLFLQIKEAKESILERYVDSPPFAHQGERVVFGQRLMQAATDVFLGHLTGIQGRQAYVRQLRDVKVKPEVEIYSPKNMLDLAKHCGWALARAHARSGDAAIMAGYIGKGKTFPNAIAQFAEAYARQNENDHAMLIEAVRDSKVEVISDV